MECTEFEIFATVPRPTGLTLHDNVIYVASASTGKLLAFDTSSGRLLDTVQTTFSSISGLKISPSGDLWFVDRSSNDLVSLSVQKHCIAAKLGE